MIWVREHREPRWHLATDAHGLVLACGEVIPGSPFVARSGERMDGTVCSWCVERGFAPGARRGLCPTCLRTGCTWFGTGECSVGRIAPRPLRELRARLRLEDGPDDTAPRLRTGVERLDAMVRLLDPIAADEGEG